MEQLLVVSLAAYRLAVLFVRDEGPIEIFQRLRRWAGVYRVDKRPELARLLSCVSCTGIWTSALAWGIWQWEPAVDVILAGAGMVTLMNEVVARLRVRVQRGPFSGPTDESG